MLIVNVLILVYANIIAIAQAEGCPTRQEPRELFEDCHNFDNHRSDYRFVTFAKKKINFNVRISFVEFLVCSCSNKRICSFLL